MPARQFVFSNEQTIEKQMVLKHRLKLGLINTNQFALYWVN